MTKRNGFLVVVGLASLLVASGAMAGPGPGRRGPGPSMGPGMEGGFGEKGHHIAQAFAHGARRVAEYLDLTEEQITASRSLAEELRATVEPIREEIGPLHEQLRTALDADNPDAATVGALMVQIDGLRDQMATAAESFEAQFVALLTPEQVEKWEHFQELRPDRGPRGRGPGQGPGHDGGHPR